MTRYEVLTLVVSVMAVVVSIATAVVAFVSLRRTGRLDEQQQQLRKKQEELTDLQLQLLRRESEAWTQREAADIRISLEKAGRDYEFVVANWGMGPARNVDLKLREQPGKASPLVKGDYDEKLPIRELLPGDRVRFFAAITFGTATRFDAVLTWTDADGSEQRREMTVSL